MASLIWSWWVAIWPNLAASVIWATPAFVAHHLLLRRHISRTLGTCRVCAERLDR
jgi:hypothetical protein